MGGAQRVGQGAPRPRARQLGACALLPRSAIALTSLSIQFGIGAAQPCSAHATGWSGSGRVGGRCSACVYVPRCVHARRCAGDAPHPTSCLGHHTGAAVEAGPAAAAAPATAARAGSPPKAAAACRKPPTRCHQHCDAPQGQRERGDYGGPRAKLGKSGVPPAAASGKSGAPLAAANGGAGVLLRGREHSARTTRIHICARACGAHILAKCCCNTTTSAWGGAAARGQGRAAGRAPSPVRSTAGAMSLLPLLPWRCSLPRWVAAKAARALPESRSSSQPLRAQPFACISAASCISAARAPPPPHTPGGARSSSTRGER